ncbi:MAG: type I restriction-modification system subunit M [Firmicutes bacterium GWF2_51_9]|nr:MAG: type I restriction-modification system subunit M [Firmicutes bacterium GWF2_51_9]OGS58489.1 MAG: type I restriction-modification system subunit M [Firmicutes bacterium GWE2_51_13]HAM62638.1 type I restriction-modification system subunit M [Erysipelotrichaceae bacterium]
MNKQQLATKIWESANKMRSKIEANEYKDYILGFIFYKYLSDKELKFLVENRFTQEDIENLVEEDTETVKYIRDNIGYFVAYKDLFNTWLKMGRNFDVSNVTDALSAFNRLINPSHKKVFEGIFNTLQTGLSKLGDSSASRTKAISDLIYLIKDIPMDGRQDYDVLGFIYEYLISMFAANAGKKAGEFYTPHEVSLLMSEIVAAHLKDRTEIKIYDPTSGSGSLLINIGLAVARHMDDENNIKYFAQELKQNTYNLTRMNLVMRGIIPDNIVTRNGDTLEDDWPYFDEANPVESYNPLYVDAVVSNPPYSQQWDSSTKETDPRYSRFGLAPKSKADYAFLLHDLYHLKPDGIMTIVLPHGVLFRGGEEGQIRKNLIEGNHIDTIIGLPANIFFGTGIPTIIMVLKQRRSKTDVLIIDASKGFIKVGNNNKLRASDIKKIVDVVTSKTEIAKFSRNVSREEIRQNEYNMNIPRYVDSSESAEKWDIYASMFGGIPISEIAELNEYWSAFPGLKESLFTYNESPDATLSVEDIGKTIKEHTSVQIYYSKFMEAFDNFDGFLKDELITKTMNINLSKEETILSDHIFNSLVNIPLIDRYAAFQLLDDEWGKVSVDLEIIQTEGFNAVKQVDPKLVLKKKDGKEEEVQDGWVGHVIPFELVQKTLLSVDYEALKQKETRLNEISSLVEEILDSLSEEEKESDILNETKDSFVAAVIAIESKRINTEMKKSVTFEEESLESKILKVDKLFSEEKDLKAKLKRETAELQLLTKRTIETLTDDQAFVLLEQKWILPLSKSINQLPNGVIRSLVDKIKALSEKYAITYADLESEIIETESTLSSLIDKLTGNEFDMKGLKEFQLLLNGRKYD